MPCGHMASLMGWLEPGTIPCVCRWPWLNGEGELGPAWRLVALRPGEVVRVQRGCQKGISESMGQCGGWEEQAAVFVVIGCCLALAAWESPWIGQNKTECHLLGPDMLQLLFEPEMGTWDLSSLSWGQFVAGWSKGLSLPDLFLPQTCPPEKRFAARSWS